MRKVIIVLALLFISAKQVDNFHVSNMSEANSFTSITTATTTVVKGTSGILHKIIIGTPIATATIKIYNVASAGCTGTPANLVQSILLPITLTNPPDFRYDINMANGICVITSGATDVLVTWE